MRSQPMLLKAYPEGPIALLAVTEVSGVLRCGVEPETLRPIQRLWLPLCVSTGN